MEEEENDEEEVEDGEREDARRGKRGARASQSQRNYNRWTVQQNDFLLEQREIKALLKRKAVPQKNTCLSVIKRSKGLLHDKGWLDIKSKVHNINNSAKARLKRDENDL